MPNVTIQDLLTNVGYFSNDELLEHFLDLVQLKGISLYEAQENAILELWDGKNVILNTPTGSGKSMVASGLHFQSIAQGRRSVYTCPIKALVNEKWMALCKEFGAENVGLSTGDATVNHDAPILCCTAEILSNIALSEGADSTISDVVMDEFHYYSDRERGVAWQIPLLTMKNTRFMLMSATLGDTSFFEQELTKLNGRPTALVKSTHRPVPLHFSWSDHPLPNALNQLVEGNKAPVYVVHFTQAEAAANAQSFTSINFCTKEEKAAIAQALEGFKFNSPYGPDLKRWIKHGIGLHHAGLLPKYRILMERLAQMGLLKVICGTDTLGVGVNVPIRSVLFTKLCKYNGDKTSILTSRDFHQVSGRAGRKGFDDVGWVVAQAPEHMIENLRLAAKSNGKKFVKRQPPEKGYVPWDEATFKKLIDSEPERLVSRFAVGHGMLLNVLSRKTDGCKALRQLINSCHDGEKTKQAHKKRAWQLFRPLAERGIIEFIEPEAPGMAKLRVKVELGEDFSMDHELSLWLLDTLPLLNSEHPEYSLDVITLCESILENPEQILRKQLDKLKTRKMAEMKADGVEYDKRIEELEKLEYPKPLREFVYETFNAFSEKHPWVGNENIRPKSIVREMFETFQPFSAYVREYDLERTEGLLLRHLNSVYKVLSNTVPDSVKTDEVRELETYLGAMIRQVDSSLLDEWEKMKNPDFSRAETQELKPPGAEDAERDITRDTKAFTALVRNRIFTILRSLEQEQYDAVLQELSPDPEAAGQVVDLDGEPWTAARLTERMEAYHEEHKTFRMDAEGRNARHTLIEMEASIWKVEQVLQDFEDLNDWSLRFEVDLAASRTQGAPVLKLNGFDTLG
jgi:superfamily II RNA helicase